MIILRLCALFLILSTGLAYGLGVNYADSFRKNIQTIIDAHPRYVWGGSETESKGLDCSGYIYLSAKRSGMAISRTVARNMRYGLSGWVGYDIELRDTEELDLIWWTFSTARPHGHIGILWRDKAGLPAVTHASGSSRGVVVGWLQGSLFRDISAIRRLTIGDIAPGRRDKTSAIKIWSD